MRSWTNFAAVALAAALAASGASALTIGQIDTFSDATTGNWFAGGGPAGGTPPVPPTVVPDGGPGGAGDPFLQVTALGGEGPGGRLVVMNGTQWAGDYLAAGIGAIEVDLRNLGTSDLAIRLLFEDPIPGPPQNIAISSVAIVLPAGGGWTHVSFDVSPGALTALMGDVGTLLANTTLLRIIHASSAAFPPDPIAGVLGIDNIAAVAAPVAIDEPSPAWLAAFALLLFAVLRRRSHRAR